MRPGFAYGGSCLPKDLSSLLYLAKEKEVQTPFLNKIEVSNKQQIEIAFKEIMKLGYKTIAIIGLAFKAGTDDLRESPTVLLVKLLIGEGINIKIYDRAVYQARLIGTNLDYIRKNIPHFEELLVAEPKDALVDTDLAVFSYPDDEFSNLLSDSGVAVFDLAGVYAEKPKVNSYHSLI